MPWINLTVRQGTFTKEMQRAVMARFTDALIFWEKIPDTPEARKKNEGLGLRSGGGFRLQRRQSGTQGSVLFHRSSTTWTNCLGVTGREIICL
jgi:hypothetical protein